MMHYPLWIVNIYTQFHGISFGNHHRLNSVCCVIIIRPPEVSVLISQFNCSTWSLKLCLVQTYSNTNMNTTTNSCMSQKQPKLFDQLFGKILIESCSLQVGINNAPEPASHFPFCFHPQAPATAQTFQKWLWVMADPLCSPWNKPLSCPIIRLNRIQFSWQGYSDICLHQDLWLWKTSHKIQRLMDRFSISSL